MEEKEICIAFLERESAQVQADLDGTMLLLASAERSRFNQSAWTAEAWAKGVDAQLAPFYAERNVLASALVHLKATLAHLKGEKA